MSLLSRWYWYRLLGVALSLIYWIRVLPNIWHSDLNRYTGSTTTKNSRLKKPSVVQNDDADDHDSPSSSSSSQGTTSIRKWGCHRNETPLIFVHIGKAGGGQVRARFAAAALDFRRTHWRKEIENDQHYYPLPNGEKAKFCNSKNQNHRYNDTQWTKKSYEGTLPCDATTPLGMALACPNAYANQFCMGCDPRRTTCHTVYVGHNHMGSEFHWLPALYLQKWWKDQGRDLLVAASAAAGGSSNNIPADAAASLAMLGRGFEALSPTVAGGPLWCPWGSLHRPFLGFNIRANYTTCGAPLAVRMDSAFHKLYNSSSSSADYSPLYASLPLHRAVLVRDPWAWIMSKFFWHRSNQWWMDDETDGGPTKRQIHCHDLSKIDYPKSPKGGWANQYLLTYLAYLCGDDCEQRLERGLMTIQQAEVQAANNLRNSFSIVGLLEETDTFLDMVSARIAYVNMSLNPEVQGERHSAKLGSEDYIVCTRIYQTPKFQTRFREAVPLMGTMERLYQLAIQVNRAQQDELDECTMHHQQVT
jgi:hypothetical protein